MLRILAIIAIAFSFSGCKQPLQSNSMEQTVMIFGRASAGPIRSADVTVYSLWPDGSRRAVIGESMTNATGLYSIVLSQYDGPIEVVVDNGYYFEEATSSLVALVHEELRARIHALGEAGAEISVTPLTEVAVSRSDRLLNQGQTLSEAILESNATTSLAAGLDDILAQPADPWSPLLNPGSQASKYAAVLAGISQMATDSGMNSLVLGQALANDFSDGKFDGLTSGGSPVQFHSGQHLGANGWSSVGTAINKFINSGANSAGFSGASESNLISEPEIEKSKKKKRK